MPSPSRSSRYTSGPTTWIGRRTLSGMAAGPVSVGRCGSVVVHPVLMAVTVTASGNHYVLDSMAGVAVALAAAACTARFRRLRLPSPAYAAGAAARLG
jgi:hypothetical protein